MNKSTFIETLRRETNLSKSKSTQVVELFFDEMTEALAAGNWVQIRGLFGFHVKNIKATPAEIPRQGNPSRYRRRNYPSSNAVRS